MGNLAEQHLRNTGFSHHRVSLDQTADNDPCFFLEFPAPALSIVQYP